MSVVATGKRMVDETLHQARRRNDSREKNVADGLIYCSVTEPTPAKDCLIITLLLLPLVRTGGVQSGMNRPYCVGDPIHCHWKVQREPGQTVLFLVCMHTIVAT